MSSDPETASSTPVKPHWAQPSHPGLIELRLAANASEFTSSAHSLVSLPAGALFAQLTFPPLERVPAKAYSTVQISQTEHVELNSDLIYVNHSCAPSLEFDVSPERMEVRVARGRPLAPGDELTFFYPSSEWEMAQPFACRCGESVCKGWIAGARQMGRTRMQGMWLNRFIEELLDEEESRATKGTKQGQTQAPTEAKPSRCCIQ
ncbi:hypothetical protein AURDEDRAFT_116124 [Auricularia subglabra TFB-10046 SS5]|uniref:Post-SET domain-containing protein n=1 Tax=Auricularia subglabra (strain TFB-10046 / SS5) TaxID=717982 RepID=J0WW13_AURST|nr:hypothetical protein AURDEDRAFT_116124 [Auricularia subglabra TFB-10046 SS5]